MLSDHEGVQSSFTKAHGFANICCELAIVQARKSCGRKNREIYPSFPLLSAISCPLLLRKDQRTCSRAKFVKRETKDRKKCWVIIAHHLNYRTKCVCNAKYTYPDVLHTLITVLSFVVLVDLMIS